MNLLLKTGLLFSLFLSNVVWFNFEAMENEPKPSQLELNISTEEVLVDYEEEFDASSMVLSGSYDQLLLPIVDTSIYGPQVITFMATLDQQQVKVNRTIFVKDDIAPVIEGEELIELKYDSEFDILSVFSVTDNIDENLELELIGDLDRLTAGEYPLQVKAVDSSNNETVYDFLVVVNEDPEILLLQERNEEFSTLVDSANQLNQTLLADTSVTAIESMLNQVNNAKALESDYQESLNQLSIELSAKLERAVEFYKEPEVSAVGPTVAAPVPTPAPTPVTPSAPAPAPQPADNSFSVTMTRYGMDCVGCVVRDGVAHTSHGIALSANAVRQPNGVWQNGITYNGRFIIAGNRNHVKCTLISIYDHPYEGRGIVQGQPIHGIMADNGAFGYNHLDLFVGTETNINAVWVANPAARPYAIITGFATFTGNGCSF